MLRFQSPPCHSKVPVNEPPPCSPKRSPYGKKCPFPEPSLTYPSGSPVKEPPSAQQVPLTEFPQRDRDTPFPEPPFISRSPWYMSPFQVSPPPTLPLEKDVHSVHVQDDPSQGKVPAVRTGKEALWASEQVWTSFERRERNRSCCCRK